MTFSKQEIKAASEVCNYLMHLSQEFPDRWAKAAESGVPYPFGDMAYGSALCRWRSVGSPPDATFSYAPDQRECPYLIEFRKELSNRFGMRIISIEEGKERARHARVNKVYDWGIN